MTDQAILDGGLDYICNAIKSTFKYIGFGNGTWEQTEKIPTSLNALKNEVYRVKVMNATYSDGEIIIFAAFKGSDIKSGDECKLTEIGLFDTESYSSTQVCLLMKVFTAITLAETDSKVVRITLNLTT